MFRNAVTLILATILASGCIKFYNDHPSNRTVSVDTPALDPALLKAVGRWNDACPNLLVRTDWRGYQGSDIIALGTNMTGNLTGAQYGRVLHIAIDWAGDHRVIMHELGHVLLGPDHEMDPSVPSVMTPDARNGADAPTARDVKALKDRGYACK